MSAARDEVAMLKRDAERIRQIAAELRADNEAAARRALRERLQALEGWKSGAKDVTEATLIDDLLWYYRDALGINDGPATSMHTPGWLEERARDGEYDG